ncbi:MAG: S46 family peptidase, partial [Bacteroidales bacterium]|nr:S46 family peptidase [Bacteroidales bacterium]
RGELIGLAFDGNKESLAGDTYFDPVMNKCICVDIRYVLWILDKYAGMQYLVAEMLGE